MEAKKLDHSDAERLREQSTIEPEDMEEETEIIKQAEDCQARNFQQPTRLATRDTRAPPDVTSRRRVVAVLGVDELNPDDMIPGITEMNRDVASPFIGNGWMVSDFYLWLHVLKSMGISQEWITSMDPAYLVSKYCMHDNTTTEDNLPTQMSWSAGFLHGGPFEERVVVLDENLLPAVREKVTLAPHGLGLRNLFMERLEHTLAEADKDAAPVLVMIFAHGDGQQSGFILGQVSEEDADESVLVSSNDIAELLKKYPNVQVTMFMTSCFSGHWVETQAFMSQNMTVLAAAGHKQEPFDFEWSLLQRHCGGLFSSAMVTELLKEPCSLPPDVDEEASREYKQMANTIIGGMLRLCIPEDIPSYGSKPVFTDPDDTTKFWPRTGYSLHEYRKNYSSLVKVPPSDPHPKTNRKKFNSEYIDNNHPDVSAWNSRHPRILDPDYPQTTGGYGGTSRGLTSKPNINFLIREFMKTNPWHHIHDQKMLVRSIRGFKAGRMNEGASIHLRKLLIHRLLVNDYANEYARQLDFYKLPPIEQWGEIMNHPRGSIMREWGHHVLLSGVFL